MIVTVELRSLCGTNPRTDSFIFIGLSESACDIHLNITWTDQLCMFLLLFVCFLYFFFVLFLFCWRGGGGVEWLGVCVCVYFVCFGFKIFGLFVCFFFIFLVVS